MSVEVVWSTIRKQAREQGHVHLLLRAKGNPETLSHTLWHTAGNTLVPDENDTIANGSYQLPAGPVVVVDHDSVTTTQATQWYQDLAASLQTQGITGKLTATPRTPPPRWVLDIPHTPAPRANLLYTTDPTNPRRRITPNTRHEIATRTSQWLRTATPGDGYLTATGPAFLVDPTTDLTSTLDAILTSRPSCLVDTVLRGTPQTRGASIYTDGKIGLSINHPDLPWQERVGVLRETLLWHPNLLDHAFIRAMSFPWNLAGLTDYPLPYSNTGADPFVWERDYSDIYDRIAYNNVVVPDAHGIQILTSAHLAHAHDLTRWTITPVAQDRYLVEAPNLEPWYAQPQPDPTTLTQARTDFGNMIITATNIDQYPRLHEHLA